MSQCKDLISLLLLAITINVVHGLPSIVPVPESYDFIIVGGGTAGCCLANRLSESGKHSVLLIEAGGEPPDFMEIPALSRRNEKIPELTYHYHSVPQQHGALGTDGGVVFIPLGKVLGGTSQINHNVYNRGSPFDFDNWANFTGDPSWSYSNMEQYFKKVENYLGEFPTEHHGYSGPMPVSYQFYSPGKEYWLEAGEELGYKTRDPNGPQEISFAPIEFTRKFGRRVSSYAGYLKPVMNERGNLRILTNAFATQIVFAGNTVIGVRYHVNSSSVNFDGTRLAKATKETIISAGAYGSATLLMRSGIGPRKVLQKAGIPILKELPVGENFQDHPAVPLLFIINNKSLSLDLEKDLTPENYELFEKFGVGPFSSAVGFSGQAFLPSSLTVEEGYPDWPDIHLSMTANTGRPSTYSNFTLEPWETSIMTNLYLGRGKSRGTVQVNPKDVNGEPLIDFNYLEDPRDEQVFLDAINKTLEIFEKTKAYQKLQARFPYDAVPSCSHLPFRSNDYWRCFIQQTTVAGNHPVGTCSMRGVVDSSLRVLGINFLRVVDGSVFPYITNANIQAPILAVAEKASNDILQTWR